MRLLLRTAPFAALVLALVPPDARASTPPTPGPTAGAWIWTRADAKLLESARAEEPALRGAVHVATIERRSDGTYASRLALSPSVAGAPGQEAAAVVRFDRSLNGAWGSDSEAAVAQGVAPLLARVLDMVDATDLRVSEIQLDYDAPVRALASWAHVVGSLASGVLRGRDVWVTSIPAHLQSAASYGELFAPSGVGHILQVFDTGLECTPEHGARLAAALVAAHLRFRIGIGGFERAARPGEHECWRAEATSWRALPGYGGVWVFPAQRDIRRALAPFEAP
jgi:hypothetical protein